MADPVGPANGAGGVPGQSPKAMVEATVNSLELLSDNHSSPEAVACLEALLRANADALEKAGKTAEAKALRDSLPTAGTATYKPYETAVDKFQAIMGITQDTATPGKKPAVGHQTWGALLGDTSLGYGTDGLAAHTSIAPAGVLGVFNQLHPAGAAPANPAIPAPVVAPINPDPAQLRTMFERIKLDGGPVLNGSLPAAATAAAGPDALDLKVLNQVMVALNMPNGTGLAKLQGEIDAATAEAKKKPLDPAVAKLFAQINPQQLTMAQFGQLNNVDSTAADNYLKQTAQLIRSGNVQQPGAAAAASPADVAANEAKQRFMESLVSAGAGVRNAAQKQGHDLAQGIRLTPPRGTPFLALSPPNDPKAQPDPSTPSFNVDVHIPADVTLDANGVMRPGGPERWVPMGSLSTAQIQALRDPYQADAFFAQARQRAGR